MRSGFALIVGAIVGCGGGAEQPPLCKAMARVCGMERDRAAECREVDAELRSDAPELYPEIVTCAQQAASCGDVFGCILGKAIDREVANERPTRKRLRRFERALQPPTPALPEQCAHITEVCSARDVDSVGGRCVRMVENLRHDPANRKRLRACIDATINCYAADNCIDEMWHDLN
jgi:hypothetical protein